jgi:predicted phage terminase large subunit-like protein
MTPNIKLLLRNDLLSFAKKAFREMNAQRMPEDRYLELLAARLAGVLMGDSKRLIVNLPPRHFKTWIGSVCLSAWILGRDPSAKILIVTYGQELADKIAHTIRGILRSEWYKELFKKTKLAKSRCKLVDFVTTAGGGVRSVSIEGGVTGHGADYIIIDDPTELKDCDNARRLGRVVELFDTVILTRLNNPKRGRVVVIAHRVNEEDLSGHLLEQGRWEHLQLPLIAMRRRSYELPDGGVWIREKGELLRPDAFTSRDIELLQVARRPGFETVQQQNPGGTRLLRIKPENFGTFPSALVPMSDSGVVLSVDPGQKGGPLHSFSVIQAWLPVRGNHLLLEQWREQAHYPVLREAVRRMIKRHNVSAVLIEDTNQGPSLVSEIRPRPGMRVCPIIPIGDKIERVHKQQAIIRSGGIKLPSDAVWRESFIAEWALFPCAGFDDQVDATVQYLEWFSHNAALPKRERSGFIGMTNSRGQQIYGAGILADRQVQGVAVSQASRRPWYW